jgi:hypothetical protein
MGRVGQAGACASAGRARLLAAVPAPTMNWRRVVVKTCLLDVMGNGAVDGEACDA